MEINQQESVTRAGSLRDAVFVYLLLFTSGSVVYMGAAQKYLVLVFLLVLGSWFLFSDRKINSGFALYVIIFTSFLFIIHLYTDGSLPLPMVIGTTMELLLAYLILKLVGDNFVESYIKVVVFLAAVSLFGFLTDSFLLFDGVIRRLPHVDEGGPRAGYEGLLYLYRGMGASIGRNASIFFEPGAYQMFLNTALLMLFFVPIRLSSLRRWVYVSVLLVALLTTFSTTGVLIFGTLFGLVIFKSDVISSHGKMALVGVLVIVVAVFTAQFEEVILEKIDKYLAIEDITDTQDRRSFDLLVDLEIFKRNIFGAGHQRYSQEFGAIGKIAEGNSSSNGVSATFAIYGLPFSLFLFGSYFVFFKKYFTGFLMQVVPFFLFLIFLFSEGYFTFTPFSMALIAAIFAFNSTEGGVIKERERSENI
ncbi:MAG: hypothetical protein ACC651_14935 [Candidatus Scalindua sp.]